MPKSESNGIVICIVVNVTMNLQGEKRMKKILKSKNNTWFVHAYPEIMDFFNDAK